MTVVEIWEENHGLICIANNYYNAIKYLLAANWLTEDYDLFDTDTEKWKTISEVLGEDWKNILLNEWDLSIFNEQFDGGFHLERTTVYEG